MALNFRDSDGTTRLSGDLLAPGGATGDVLTQGSDGTYAPAAPDAPAVLTATVTLDDDEIKALATANDGEGYELVAAPAAGQVLWCRGVLLTAHTVVAYDYDVGGFALGAVYRDAEDNSNQATTTLAADGVGALLARSFDTTDGYALLEPYASAPDASSYDSVRVSALRTNITGLAGAITAGDPANTLTWHVLYAVASVQG